MSLVSGARARAHRVLRVSAAIVRSPIACPRALPFVLFASACGGPPAPDVSQEILERLDRIETRLAAIETRDRDEVDTPARDGDTAAPARPGEPAPTLADPFARAATPVGTSLAIALTRGGWSVDGRIVDERELSKLLSGVGSVTVRTDDGVPQEDVVALLDLLREADIRQVAIARFSDQSVTAGRIEP